jgi:hypothetical protein
MACVSYAQNAEDVRLRRAFKDQSSGFYVDVGANHPIENSVTKHFYDSGWTGINVEPAPGPFALIAKERKRDINLNVGCSNRPGSLTLYTGRGNAIGLSSFEEVAIHRDALKAELSTYRAAGSVLRFMAPVARGAGAVARYIAPRRSR